MLGKTSLIPPMKNAFILIGGVIKASPNIRAGIASNQERVKCERTTGSKKPHHS
jgi:hypothetical protein